MPLTLSSLSKTKPSPPYLLLPSHPFCSILFQLSPRFILNPTLALYPGLYLWQCRDNGVGIPIEDRQYLGTRYATSKITSVEDILSVKTYGFRGEALASLCVISSLSLTTRVANEPYAIQSEFDHNGHTTSYTPSLTTFFCVFEYPFLIWLSNRTKRVAGEIGTCVVVRNLFKGLPVRLAEAKKHRVSVSKVKSLIMTYALVRGGVRFLLHYRGNKRINWNITGGNNPMDVAVSVFGKDIVRKYEQVTWNDGNIHIDGIVPHLNEGMSPPKKTNSIRDEKGLG